MSEKGVFEGKKLYRSQANRMLGGVCGGVAEYFNIDPTVVRLIWITVALFGGVGILAYIASLIIIPNNPDQEPTERDTNLIKDKSLFWGSILVIVGIFLLLRQMGLFYSFHIRPSKMFTFKQLPHNPFGLCVKTPVGFKT